MLVSVKQLTLPGIRKPPFAAFASFCCMNPTMADFKVQHSLNMELGRGVPSPLS